MRVDRQIPPLSTPSEVKTCVEVHRRWTALDWSPRYEDGYRAPAGPALILVIRDDVIRVDDGARGRQFSAPTIV